MQGSREEEADRTLYVGNLECNVKEETLFELFLQAGPLTRVHIPKDQEGNHRSFGFVCFKHTESVPYAISMLNGIRLYGQPIKIRYRSGKTHTAESGNPSQDPVRGLYTNPQVPWMSGAGNGFAPSMANMNDGYFSQAYMYYCSLMNPYMAYQNTACGLMPQVPPCYNESLPWSQNGSTQLYQDPGSSYSAGPRCETWGLTDPRNSVWCQKDPKKRKGGAEARDSTSDDTDGGSDQPVRSKNPEKHETKRRN
uniref:RNA binding motif protein 11 n=1 Tax=Leptobrachium leishanense TaxID=445787 RepID=A0A8C5N103_9ANUR